ncbi:hypothetical protein [Flavobacterium sp. HBTb2-11-1]|uniref:hypothetical protein n=1 Tax=Flavobacterium sp. HBTb2-11-1 TaxID=2692212 RepID=UPI001370DA55|nr:hypothetical protein [Flavobacterium sp. HBTb2-11-1]MXO04613.1 hypothetical protein [Flavobacterium sp. HBTb2-11-1]
MKSIFYLFKALGFIINCKGQNALENKFIEKIDYKSSTKIIEKLEFSREIGSRGDYTKTVVYLKKSRPILIEIEKKEIIHLYLIDDTEKDMTTKFFAKFYILNWKKNQYIRRGKIIENENLEYNMADNYFFEYNIEDVKNEIAKKYNLKTSK